MSPEQTSFPFTMLLKIYYHMSLLQKSEKRSRCHFDHREKSFDKWPTFARGSKENIKSGENRISIGRVTVW
jgi:hypothetical protein